jgi:hypothetical protein
MSLPCHVHTGKIRHVHIGNHQIKLARIVIKRHFDGRLCIFCHDRLIAPALHLQTQSV